MIFFKPKSAPFPEDYLIHKFLRDNPHGVGAVSQEKVKRWTDCFPDELHEFAEGSSIMVHFRLASRGGVCSQNIHPFTDKRLPGYYFAHNGTLGYSTPSGMTDSEWFYKNKVVPYILEHGSSIDTLSELSDIRTVGSRFILWNGRSDESPFFYGQWHWRNGVFFSRPLPESIPVGETSIWWKLPDSYSL